MITILFTNGSRIEFPTGDYVDDWSRKETRTLTVQQYLPGNEGKFIRPSSMHVRTDLVVYDPQDARCFHYGADEWPVDSVRGLAEVDKNGEPAVSPDSP